MNGFSTILLLRGRLSRVPYALMAVPLLLLRQFGHVLTSFAPLLFERVFHAGMTDVVLYSLIFFLLMDALLVVLMIVSVSRLHDIGLTGFLVLPYIFPVFIGFYVSQSEIGHLVVSPAMKEIITWLSRGTYWYCLALALVMLFVPGRKPPVAADPVPAF
jgi:uncharacterized membrane protein YhaH (DUF805 family)